MVRLRTEWGRGPCSLAPHGWIVEAGCGVIAAAIALAGLVRRRTARLGSWHEADLIEEGWIQLGDGAPRRKTSFLLLYSRILSQDPD